MCWENSLQNAQVTIDAVYVTHSYHVIASVVPVKNDAVGTLLNGLVYENISSEIRTPVPYSYMDTRT